MKEMAKITSKGQVTIPKDLRTIMKLEMGDRVEFETIPRAKKVIMRKVKK